MNWRSHLFARWRSALAGATLCVLLGVGLLRWGHELVFLSYDLLFAFHPTRPPDDALIVYMDDRSFSELKQDSTATWDRNLHAQLLDQMTRAGAKLVVFDLVWNLPGTPSANTNLARAIKQNGHVVLAGALNPLARPQIELRSPDLPLPEFLNAAAGWGITEMMSSEKAVARQYFVGTETQPSLPWRAASLVGAKITQGKAAAQPDWWLNYYGPALTLPYMSYCDVGAQPPERFRGKVIFVGARPRTLKPGDEADAFRTPYTLWTHEFTPGVEITATAFLNLVHHNGLYFLSWPGQLWLVLVAGILLGSVLGLMRPGWAIGSAVVVVVATVFIAMEAARHHVWIPWTIVVFAQVPVALVGSLRGHFNRLKFEREVLERTLAGTSRVAGSSSTEAGQRLVIPDHELVRCVGRGAYGEVWLARNVVGVFHAVKIVRRNAFPDDVPYEREFKGIQKFMPVSRSHPGLVHILHVGRNDQAGCFYCIMEAADDFSSGQRINPESYSPHTLAFALQQKGKLAPADCVRLGCDLSAALEHLHRQQLVHRDIKPGNIIFVNGGPKFADIGLVTELRAEPKEISLVGTEGYVPPEGPGTPAADVYALGKVLYEACMGRDRQLFPEVPTAVWEEPDDGLLRRLNAIVAKACATSTEERFSSAAELHAALLVLANPGQAH